VKLILCRCSRNFSAGSFRMYI